MGKLRNSGKQQGGHGKSSGLEVILGADFQGFRDDAASLSCAAGAWEQGAKKYPGLI
jgi:hypothetical protein